MTDEAKATETEDQQAANIGADDALDLEALLSETTDTKEAGAETEPTQDKPDLNRVISYIDRKEKEEIATQFQADLGKATATLKDALPEHLRGVIPDSMAKGFLIGQAEDDPRLARAFAQRDKDPRTWDKAVQAIAKEFAKPYESLPDTSATEDREAVRAAARSTQIQPETELDAESVSKMDKPEFDSAQRKLGVRPYGT